jgi:PAS domain S-box-containing protein
MPTTPDLASTSFQRNIEELEDLYENAPCGYLSIEPSGRISRVNTTFRGWLGHSSDELLSLKFQDLLNVTGKIYYETHFAPLLRMQGFFNEVALDLVAKSGHPIPVLVNAVEKRGEDGHPSLFRITVFNATDRRRYERELLAARNALANVNKELRAFYDTLPVGIFRADASGRLVQTSQRFRDVFENVVADDQSIAEQELQRLIDNGEPLSTRFSIAIDDEAARQIELKAVPIYEDGDKALVFVGVIDDVTEQVLAEVRRGEIDRQSAISQISGGLAHNLNNILMVVMGNLEILEMESADRVGLRQTLDDTLNAADKAAAIIRRLLVYSGYSTASNDVFEVDLCLRDLIQEFASEYGQDYELVCDLRAPRAAVEMNTGMLKDAVHELIANAAAAMPSGGEIRLSTRLEEAETSNNQRKIVVGVRDSGIGMDEAIQTKAREPFFSTRGLTEGMGLGLSLVDGVARIAGGELVLRSNPGTGSSVELHLPLRS